MFNKRPPLMLSFSYFFCSDPLLLIHRTLFLMSCNTPKRMFSQTLSHLCWIGYDIWKHSYHACKAATSEQLNDYGLTRFKLFWEFITIGLRYSLRPSQYIAYQLYKKDNQKHIFCYFYNQELPYFHHYCNRNFPDYLNAIALISDKYQFEKALHQLAIPTVQSEQVSANEFKEKPEILFQKRKIFCKPNTASGSRGSFLLDYDEPSKTYQLTPIHGNNISDPQAINDYLKQIFSNHQSLLIQPFLEDHPDLQTEFSEAATTTFRIITGKTSPLEKAKVLYIQQEIPKIKKRIKTHLLYQFYTILPLHWKSLDIDPVFLSRQPMIQTEKRELTPKMKHALQTGIENCMRAHDQLLNLRSVSFDIIVGPQGPIFLEANFNWGIELLYNVIPLGPLSRDCEHPAILWLTSLFPPKKSI